MVIVGISGVTNGGKSVLVGSLRENLPRETIVLSQDDYFYPEDSVHHVPCPGGLPHHNWDIITSLDMNKMVEDIRKHQQLTDRILLLDGFILYDDPRVTELCDLRFFITLDRQECKRRRDTRNYDPPDIPGYFDACVWPMYEDHLKRLQSMSDTVIFLDGASSPQDNLDIVTKRIINTLENNG